MNIIEYSIEVSFLLICPVVHRFNPQMSSSESEDSSEEELGDLQLEAVQRACQDTARGGLVTLQIAHLLQDVEA